MVFRGTLRYFKEPIFWRPNIGWYIRKLGKRTDATLIGKNLANRRNLHVGDSFDAAGITVQIAGIIETLDDSAQNDNVAFVHLSIISPTSFENRSWPCYSI